MKEETNRRLKNAGIIILTVGIVTLICLFIFLFFGNKFLLKSYVQFEEDQTLTSSTTETSSISIPGFESMTIEAGATTVSTNLYNPESNDCYFVISIILEDTGEEIYRSDYLKPGQHLYEITLNYALSEGEYSAIIHYDTYSTDDLTELNGANVPITIIVK